MKVTIKPSIVVQIEEFGPSGFRALANFCEAGWGKTRDEAICDLLRKFKIIRKRGNTNARKRKVVARG